MYVVYCAQAYPLCIATSLRPLPLGYTHISIAHALPCAMCDRVIPQHALNMNNVHNIK